MNKQDKSKKAPTEVTDISVQIAALAARFKPANNPSEATHWFSTEEVVAAIKDVDPSAKVDATLVHDALRQAGYSYRTRPGSQSLSFRWMFRAKD